MSARRRGRPLGSCKKKSIPAGLHDEPTSVFSQNSLRLQSQAVGLENNVRELLDWLISEELKRWQQSR